MSSEDTLSRQIAAVHYLVQPKVYGKFGFSWCGCDVTSTLKQHKRGVKRLQECQQKTLELLASNQVAQVSHTSCTATQHQQQQ